MAEDYEVLSEDEPAARFTTVHSRYQVCDDICGLVEWYQRKAEATKRAESHKELHQREGCPLKVVVYDRMGRKGQPDTWEF